MGPDVQGCKLLGQWILRAVLWIQAGHHGGLCASQWRCVLLFLLRHGSSWCWWRRAVLVWECYVCVMLRAGVWWCCDNANTSASASASCIDDDDDSGAHYDGSVFGDVQGCKLLGQWILRAVL